MKRSKLFLIFTAIVLYVSFFGSNAMADVKPAMFIYQFADSIIASKQILTPTAYSEVFYGHRNVEQVANLDQLEHRAADMPSGSRLFFMDYKSDTNGQPILFTEDGYQKLGKFCADRGIELINLPLKLELLHDTYILDGAENYVSFYEGPAISSAGSPSDGVPSMEQLIGRVKLIHAGSRIGWVHDPKKKFLFEPGDVEKFKEFCTKQNINFRDSYP